MSRRTKESIRDVYIQWLGNRIQDEYGIDHSNKTYWDLIHVMFEKPFFFTMEMDSNRVEDGLYLRVDFKREEHIPPSLMPNLGPCSFLEVLVGLSRRLEFVAGGSAPGWGWQLLCNLELDRMSDPLTRAKHRKVQEIMDTVMERRYNPDGTGGFFPLTYPEDDQTRIELWTQLNSYVKEFHKGEY